MNNDINKLVMADVAMLNKDLDDIANFVGRVRITGHRYSAVFLQDLELAMRKVKLIPWYANNYAPDRYCNLNRITTFLTYFGFDLEREAIGINSVVTKGIVHTEKGRRNADKFLELAKAFIADAATLAWRIANLIRVENGMEVK